jgi:hypothetical protein
MVRAALLIALVAIAAGCGSDDDEAAGTEATAVEVESAVKSHLSQGGSGIVRLEDEQPKQITCVKDAGSASGWRCTVTLSKGAESYLCIVEVDPQTKQTTKVTCARIDN